MTPAPSLTDVLDAVNVLRDEYNIGRPLTELPRGKPIDPFKCVVALALGCSCTESRFYPRTEAYSDSAPLPQILTDFIHAFDRGYYPALMER